jgi:hypothetical protein
MESNEFRMDASLRAASSEWNDRASFNRFARSDLMRPAPGMRIGGFFGVCEPRALHPDNGSLVGHVDLHSASSLQKFGPKTAARKRRFDQPFQRDLGCPAAPSKIFRLTCRANQFYQLAVSSRQEGRIAIVTNAGWDAVDAAASGAQMESQGRFIL